MGLQDKTGRREQAPPKWAGLTRAGVALGMVAALSGSTMAAEVSTRSLVAAETQRFAAMVSGDIPALDRALGRELTYVHSSSVAQTKTEHLRDLQIGRADYDAIVVEAQSPAVYGKVGVINGVARFITSGGGRKAESRLRYTDVYVLRDGRWQMVAWHCTRVPDAPPAPN